MRGWNWGHPDPLQTIEARDCFLFAKLRQRSQRRRIICFVDYNPSLQPPETMIISPNLFVWAEHEQIPVVFMFTSLGDDGRIRIELDRVPGAERSASRTPLFDLSSSGAAGSARCFVQKIDEWP